MIEQPLMHDDLIDHAKLAHEISTPICLDESITSLDKARQAVEIGACRWVNIKLGRVGGITNAIAIHDFLARAGIPCWIGSMVESAVGAAHNVAVATLKNVKYPSDIFPSDRFYENDLGKPPMVMSGRSQISARAGPGIGVEPEANLLQRATLQLAVLS